MWYNVRKFCGDIHWCAIYINIKTGLIFDGFKGNLTSSKWAKICKVSQDTASREINALVDKSILRREGQGRSTHYVLA